MPTFPPRAKGKSMEKSTKKHAAPKRARIAPNNHNRPLTADRLSYSFAQVRPSGGNPVKEHNVTAHGACRRQVAPRMHDPLFSSSAFE